MKISISCKPLTLLMWIALFPFLHLSAGEPGEVVREAKATVTVVELDAGETLRFHRTDGEQLTLRLVSTGARILYTNKDRIPEDESGHDGGNMFRARLLYEFTAEVLINEVPMTLRRYVSSQESFYEPYVVNGVRLWFDGVQDIFEQDGGFLSTARRENGRPDKNARFLLQDMTKRIAPERIHAPFKDGEERDPNYIYKENFIDVGRAFNGDNAFLGAYLGGQSHGALDINMAMDSLMYAPFGVDTQEGIRFNGERTWPDGSRWHFSLGHMAVKHIADNVPVRGGTAFGRGARRACWWHPHAHFGWMIKEHGRTYQIDPWILIWQHFEDNKREDGILRAMMEPLEHARTGSSVQFRNASAAETEDPISFYWTFGDGGWSDEEHPRHTYARPGIYPVTLTVDTGSDRAAFTQHITVEGESTGPALVVRAPDEPTFRNRPLDAMDVYGWPVAHIPHTLAFTARPSRPVPDTRTLELRNIGGGTLPNAVAGVEYLDSQEWLAVEVGGEGNAQELTVRADATGMRAGTYEANVVVHTEGALNTPQRFRVVLRVPAEPPVSPKSTIDNSDPGFYATPYFWIGHRFHGWGWPPLAEAEGVNNFYLMNGERARPGEFARFTPDLEAGWYTLWLHEKTPFASGPPADHTPTRFKVRIRHAEGDDWVWMEPAKTEGFFPRPFRSEDGWSWLERQPTRVIGSYKFNEGTDGFVEIHAEDSTGQVLVDAVRFLRWWRD